MSADSSVYMSLVLVAGVYKVGATENIYDFPSPNLSLPPFEIKKTCSYKLMQSITLNSTFSSKLLKKHQMSKNC